MVLSMATSDSPTATTDVPHAMAQVSRVSVSESTNFRIGSALNPSDRPDASCSDSISRQSREMPVSLAAAGTAQDLKLGHLARSPHQVLHIGQRAP